MEMVYSNDTMGKGGTKRPASVTCSPKNKLLAAFTHRGAPLLQVEPTSPKVHATTPEELQKAVAEVCAVAEGPTDINLGCGQQPHQIVFGDGPARVRELVLHQL